MKYDKLITAAWSCVLSFIISVASVACLVTGFDMTVSLFKVVLWCGIASLGATICFILPLSLLPVSAAALLGGYLWQEGSLELSVQSLLFRITRQYNRAYGWGVIRLNMYTADDMELTLWLGLCFLGALIAIGVAWAICRRKTGFAATVPAVLVLFLCFITIDTVPDLPWLFFVLFGIALVLFTHTVRRADEVQGNRLSFMVAAPLGVALLLLFVLIPQKNYTGQTLAQNIETAVLESKLVNRVFGDLSGKGTSGTSIEGNTVRLDYVGVRLQSKAQILQVDADFTGTVYLRGRGLDAYDGKSWTNSGDSYGNLIRKNDDYLYPRGTVLITTKYAHSMQYVPYYMPSDTMAKITTVLNNPEKMTQYSFACYQAQLEEFYDREFDFDTGNYLQLSHSVKRWAEPMAKRITQDVQGVYYKAQAIGDYVRQTAVYDLNTAKMPGREEDFAKWFLEKGETGYCIHFATAATVLLQAAGIPARYVTGYMVDVQDGEYTTVRSEDAHAWAEYYLPGFGWTILEATPAAQEPGQEVDSTEQTLPDKEPSAGKDFTIPAKVWWLLGIGVFVAAITALVIRRLILSALRLKRLNQGAPRQLVLARWGEIARITRYLGEMPPEELLIIAEKAKFSQHTPTAEDVAKLDDHLSKCIDRLKQKSVFHKVWYRLILVLY